MSFQPESHEDCDPRDEVRYPAWMEANAVGEIPDEPARLHAHDPR